MSSSECTCENKHVHGHGSARSLVRRIGSRLPIQTGRRIYIRVPGIDSPGINLGSAFRYEATGEHYVPNEEGLTLASYINNPRQLLSKTIGLLEPMQEEWVRGSEEVEGEVQMEVGEEELTSDAEVTGGKQEAIEKISALESELAKLKAQIAIYALAEADLESDDVIPAPPPPPLPPPLPATPMHKHTLGGAISSTPSGFEGPIAASRTPAPRDPTNPQATEYFATPALPDRASMFRDIGSVKLKTVDMARSPGGTPLRPTNKGGRMADPNDPASIIAQALRKKFSHKIFRDSPDKENLDRSDASLPPGFESPTVKFLK